MGNKLPQEGGRGGKEGGRRRRIPQSIPRYCAIDLVWEKPLENPVISLLSENIVNGQYNNNSKIQITLQIQNTLQIGDKQLICICVL